VRLLVLVDVDGTLFLTHDPLAGQALQETLEEQFDARLPADSIERVDHAGQTSLRIARLVLEAAGLADIDSRRLSASPSAISSSSRLRTRAAGASHPTPTTHSRSFMQQAIASPSSPATPSRWPERAWSVSASSGSFRRARARSVARPSRGWT